MDNSIWRIFQLQNLKYHVSDDPTTNVPETATS